MKLAIIGDFRKENKTHQGTNAAIRHSLDQLHTSMEVDCDPHRRGRIRS